MTTDPFRRHQKALCVSGAPNRAGLYGCSCCRKLYHLGDFKRFARKHAKTQLRRETKKLVAEQLREAS
jgi:hypothetical protein